ncbi:hypothetical protein ACWFMI_16750 [Nocardiopsis terrae]
MSDAVKLIHNEELTSVVEYAYAARACLVSQSHSLMAAIWTVAS